jgi:hypothetical protein
MKKFANPVLLLIALSIFACTGGGSGGGGNPPTGPGPTVILTPQAGPMPSLSLRRGSGTVEDDLELEILATGLNDVGGLDFVLLFPNQLMRFETAVAGPFLGQGTVLNLVPQTPGALRFIMTRTLPGGASGSGVIATVRFRGLAAGSGAISFADREAVTPTGLPISGINWLGGTVRITS